MKKKPTVRRKKKTFRQKKIEQLARAITAYSKFKFGCAFVPGYHMGRAERIRDLMFEWLRDMTAVRRWPK